MRGLPAGRGLRAIGSALAVLALAAAVRADAPAVAPAAPVQAATARADAAPRAPAAAAPEPAADAGPAAPNSAAPESTPAAPGAGAEKIVDPSTFAALPTAERRALFAGLGRDQQLALLRGLSTAQLIAIARQGLERLGSYQAEMVKQERIKGELQAPQTIRIELRESPYAIRMEVIDGPGRGRKVLYNSALRPGQLRGKESGLLGLVGGVWLDIDGSMVRGDTNHVITDTGFESTLRLMEQDLAATGDKLRRSDEGWDADGLYCMRVTAPPGLKSYAARLKLCFDPQLELPVFLECEDAAGLFERFRWRKVRHAALSAEDFTPDAMGL